MTVLWQERREKDTTTKLMQLSVKGKCWSEGWAVLEGKDGVRLNNSPVKQPISAQPPRPKIGGRARRPPRSLFDPGLSHEAKENLLPSTWGLVVESLPDSLQYFLDIIRLVEDFPDA
jgi:hypothetical protein